VTDGEMVTDGDTVTEGETVTTVTEGDGDTLTDGDGGTVTEEFCAETVETCQESTKIPTANPKK
jgi:hypothetical protein